MKIAILHRYPPSTIKETNAAFPYLQAKGMDVLTFMRFDRLSKHKKFWKSLAWIFYAPFLVAGKGYDVIYCDDSFPFYPALVKLVCPKSRVVIRIGDFHLMYYYSGIVYQLLHFFEVITWLCVDDIIAISGVMAEKIRADIGWAYWTGKADNVHVVPDPVDQKDFPLSDKDDPDPNAVMFHGVLTKNKNIDILLEAAKRLPKVNFIIIGDGPDFKRLYALAPDNVLLLGWVPFYRMASYISFCTVGVAVRSDNAGNEYVVTSPYLQYSIMGKPCLVTRRKVFGDYPWQFSNVEELVEKLGFLLTEQSDGKGLRLATIAEHGAEKIAEEIWQILMQR